jgi:glycosyltransferase involved in cell wall biosynthesis
VTDSAPPSLLYVSTLDHIIRVMLPHLDAARARGWRVEVACQVTRFRPELEAHTDRIHDLPLQRFPLHPSNAIALGRLTRLIRRERYTVVHCHNPTGGFVGRLAATLAGAGSLRVYTAHGFHFHRLGGRMTNALYRGVETVAGRLLSDAVFVINREDFDTAGRGGVVAPDRLFLTGGVGVSAGDDFNPAAVSAEDRAAVRREFGVAGDAALITVVGEMIPRKRHIDALHAFALLKDRFPDAVLALVGDGALMETLKTEAATLGVSDRVRFPGFRRDIAPILSATDVFLFPSRQEGLPCSIQEALAMRAPVVATDIRGCADLVDTSCGRLAPVGDVAALAEQVAALLDAGPAARREMGAAGREKMLRLYDRPRCVEEWLGLYDRLLAAKASATAGPAQ